MYIKQVLLGIQFRNFRQLWYMNFLTTPRTRFITHIKASIWGLLQTLPLLIVQVLICEEDEEGKDMSAMELQATF
jgi:hypothetical protein